MAKQFYLRNGRVEFTVQRIRDHHLTEETTYFLVQWKGLGLQTWEPLANLNCPKALHLYALRRERLLNGLPLNGLSKIVNGISESTLEMETAHSLKLALNLTGSWIKSEHGTKSSMCSSEELRSETTQAKMTSRGFTSTSVSSYSPQTQEELSSTTSDSPSIVPGSNGATTSVSETHLPRSQGGGSIIQKKNEDH